MSRHDKWIVWQLHWTCAYKPQRFGVHHSENEAKDACDRLNASPSGRWYSYTVEFRPASEPSNHGGENISGHKVEVAPKGDNR